jgi:hypothetical protein
MNRSRFWNRLYAPATRARSATGSRPRRWRRGLALGLAVAALAGGVAYAQDWVVLDVMATVDNRLFTGDGDWYFGAAKTECGNATRAVGGMSVTKKTSCSGIIFRECTTEYARTLLCGNVGLDINQSMGATLNIKGRNHMLDNTWGDWAPNLWKGECGPTGVVTGIATETSYEGDGYYSMLGLRCSDVVGIRGATSCATLDFRNQDQRETDELGDWSPGYLKGQCGPGRYVKGVAHGGGRPVSILCCSPLR